MSLILIDDLAYRASERSRTFTLALSGVVLQALNGLESAQRSAKKMFAERSESLFVSHFFNEQEHLSKGSATIAAVAYSDAMISLDRDDQFSEDDSLNSHVAEVVEQVNQSLTAQVHRDYNQAKKALRDVSLQVDMMTRSRGWKRSAALIAIRQQNSQEIKFSFKDRSGRSWASDKYTYTLLRSHYLSIYNEVYLYALTQGKIEVAHVKHEDANHKHNGLRFSIAPSETNESDYFSIAPSVFHPNSRALVSRL